MRYIELLRLSLSLRSLGRSYTLSIQPSQSKTTKMKQTSIIIAAMFATHISTVAGPLDRDPKPQGVAFAINGKFYHDLELVSVDGGIAEFQSKEGKVSAPWSSLPAAFQRSNADQKVKLEARAKAAKVEAETPRMRIQVVQVFPNGVLADQMKEEFISTGRASSMASIGGGGGVSGGDVIVYRPSGKIIFLAGVTGLADGAKLSIRAKRDGTYTHADSTVEKWILTETLKQ